MSVPLERSSVLHRSLTGLAGAVVALTLLHDLDHLRQGRDLPVLLDLIGVVGTASSIALLVWVSRGGRGAVRAAALFGALTAVGLLGIHVAPRWSPISDPYGAADVDVRSWLGLAALIAAAIALAVVAGERIRSR